MFRKNKVTREQIRTAREKYGTIEQAIKELFVAEMRLYSISTPTWKDIVLLERWLNITTPQQPVLVPTPAES